MSFQNSLTRALGEIDRAGDIVKYSTVVVTRDKQLRNVDLSVFQKGAAVEFQFLPSFEESIHSKRAKRRCGAIRIVQLTQSEAVRLC
ncbi:hypothetical protein HZZ13_01620 [Bradyrhizobium sp. CNPSo 4010]|uniref:PIN domain-containing protein n=1 Tax=Bradyrhizobium agreste TaxID=2751811 RepID=A0ABS0PH39_9BRAD|nr:hypothetical protein [Bradyrhizobium agreste]MBH5396507.1 hypothetical protein [Bradyrhizobium agreste]